MTVDQKDANKKIIMPKNESINKPLKDWLAEFYDDTGKISDIIRNLALAGIGLIWIFKNSDLTHDILPKGLIPALRFIVLGLITDLLQYLWRAINIYIFYKINEIKYQKGKLTNQNISDVTIPNYIAIGTWIIFCSKIILVTIAYYVTIQYQKKSICSLF